MADNSAGCHSTRASRRIPILFFHAGTGLLRVRDEQPFADALQGVTNDLERRVAEHREGKPGSFTARYNVTRLVYFERFDYIRDAIARESGIKRMLRAEKIALIESMNPQWQDLSEV